MKAAIVKIGNSRGIRIPKPVFEQCGFTDEVELEVENHRLVVRSISLPRANWEESFSLMAKKGEDVLQSENETISNDWDGTEWEWK
jgi:antitoxin MazE